ncbi:MAG: hypothetical protein LBD58_10490 [Treponema sp.]|nr:hypothetical protein [Treponema sp.]
MEKVKAESLSGIIPGKREGSYNETIKDWRGRLVMAIDSSHIVLTRDTTLQEYYGATGHALSAATARMPLLYDVESDIIVDAKIEPLAASGRSLAKERLEALDGMGLDFGERKPTIIFERGHPSKNFIKYFQYKEIECIIQVRKKFNTCIDNMRGGSEVVKLTEGMKTWAIVFRLKSGEREALITNAEEGG